VRLWRRRGRAISVVLLRQERLDRRVTCGLCHGCECVYPHVCCHVVCCFGRGDACVRFTQLSSRGRYDFASLFCLLSASSLVCVTSLALTREGLVCRHCRVHLLLSVCVVVPAAVTPWQPRRRAAVCRGGGIGHRRGC
jgi:hypothetical protein